VATDIQVSCCIHYDSELEKALKFVAWFRSKGLNDRGSKVLFPAVAGSFSLHHRFQNGSGAHPASCIMGTRDSLPGGKAAGM
jgi:hypothetical protein